jgi:membrane dipeptidase
MNRWGIMVDVSHPSKQANLQAIALSKAPVIASHSAARAIADHSRNMDDEQLEALKKNGGVIQTVAFDSYVKVKPPDSAERAAAIAKPRVRSSGRGWLRSTSSSRRRRWPRWPTS